MGILKALAVLSLGTACALEVPESNAPSDLSTSEFLDGDLKATLIPQNGDEDSLSGEGELLAQATPQHSAVAPDFGAGGDAASSADSLSQGLAKNLEMSSLNGLQAAEFATLKGLADNEVPPGNISDDGNGIFNLAMSLVDAARGMVNFGAAIRPAASPASSKAVEFGDSQKDKPEKDGSEDFIKLAAALLEKLPAASPANSKAVEFGDSQKDKPEEQGGSKDFMKLLAAFLEKLGEEGSHQPAASPANSKAVGFGDLQRDKTEEKEGSLDILKLVAAFVEQLGEEGSQLMEIPRVLAAASEFSAGLPPHGDLHDDALASGLPARVSQPRERNAAADAEEEAEMAADLPDKSALKREAEEKQTEEQSIFARAFVPAGRAPAASEDAEKENAEEPESEEVDEQAASGGAEGSSAENEEKKVAAAELIEEISTSALNVEQSDQKEPGKRSAVSGWGNYNGNNGDDGVVISNANVGKAADGGKSADGEGKPADGSPDKSGVSAAFSGVQTFMAVAVGAILTVFVVF